MYYTSCPICFEVCTTILQVFRYLVFCEMNKKKHNTVFKKTLFIMFSVHSFNQSTYVFHNCFHPFNFFNVHSLLPLMFDPFFLSFLPSSYLFFHLSVLDPLLISSLSHLFLTSTFDIATDCRSTWAPESRCTQMNITNTILLFFQLV